MQTPYMSTSENIRLEPVYVNEDTNELVYHSRLMVKDKKYHITWCGEHFMLIRSDDGVSVYVRDENDE